MAAQIPGGFDLASLAPALLESLGAAVTVFDPGGAMLYYNTRAAKILDRCPELLGKNVAHCHQLAKSKEAIAGFIAKFKAGRTEDIHYWAKTEGAPKAVRISPLYRDGTLLALVQTVFEVPPPPG